MANLMQTLLARLPPLKRIGATLASSRNILATSDPYLSCASPLEDKNETRDLGAVVVFGGDMSVSNVTIDKQFDNRAQGELLRISVPLPSMTQEEVSGNESRAHCSALSSIHHILFQLHL